MSQYNDKRPDIIDWGIVGENSALRQVNTRDPVDMERYWVTNRSVGAGLMVADIETMEELVVNAKFNGRRWGFTLAISGTSGPETGEFQGFVQFTEERGLRDKIEATGLFVFFKDVTLWEVSYARYPHSLPHQVASAVRQACVFLIGKLERRGMFPRVAVIGATEPNANPGSLRVLARACFNPIATSDEHPEGIIQYDDTAPELDTVWLLNWHELHHRLRQKAAPEWEKSYKAC